MNRAKYWQNRTIIVIILITIIIKAIVYRAVVRTDLGFQKQVHRTRTESNRSKKNPCPLTTRLRFSCSSTWTMMRMRTTTPMKKKVQLSFYLLSLSPVSVRLSVPNCPSLRSRDRISHSFFIGTKHVNKEKIK